MTVVRAIHIPVTIATADDHGSSISLRTRMPPMRFLKQMEALIANGFAFAAQ